MSYGLQLALIFAMVILGCAKVTLQGQVSRRFLRNTSDSVLFNAELFVVISVVMAILFPLGRIETVGILLAVLTACGTVIFQTTYTLALRIGPVSLTVLIANLSSFITVIFSMIAYRESFYLTQLIGILFLVLSMLLGIKRTDDEKGINGKWLLLVLMMTIANGVASVIMKVFSKEMSVQIENSQNTFMVLCYLSAACLAVGLFCVTSRMGRRERASFGIFNKGVLIFVLAIGVVLGIYQKLHMIGLEKIDSGFMLPTYSGLQSLGMTFIGILMFGDKLSTRQKIGIACGIICVILMNVRIIQLF